MVKPTPLKEPLYSYNEALEWVIRQGTYPADIRAQFWGWVVNQFEFKSGGTFDVSQWRVDEWWSAYPGDAFKVYRAMLQEFGECRIVVSW